MFSVKSLFIGLFCVTSTLLCGVEPEPHSPQENNALVLRRLFDLSFRDTNWDLLAELVAEDVVIHNVGLNHDQVGLECARNNQLLGQKAFQQVGWDIHELFARDDRVVIVWTCHLIHVGEYLDVPATQKNVAVSGVSMYRFNDEGKICEIWGSFDRLGVIKQIADL